MRGRLDVPRIIGREIESTYPSPRQKSVADKENLQAIAHRRLYPSLTDPNYLVLRARRLIFRQWIERLGQGLNVLDIGGRYQPYRRLLQGKALRYTAVDLLRTEWVDVVASGEKLPFPENTFDLVIVTQVFEYFNHPSQAAQQIHAVLKPGGVLLMSAVGFAPRFVNEERWRFTSFGIRTLLAPFSEVDIVPEAHSPAGLVRAVSLFFHWFLPSRPLKKLYSFLLCPLLNLLGLALERFPLSRNDQFTPNFSARARK